MTTSKQDPTAESLALKAIIDSLGELPSSPAVVGLVMGMTSDLNTDVKKLSRALSADQAIAAKTLKLSNSPLYGRPGGVGSVEEAVLVLGFFTVRSLVIVTATYSMFQTDDPHSFESRLWDHSLASAIAARLIARRLRHPAVEECYLAGLLHDVGKLIFIQRFPTEYRELLRRSSEEGVDLIQLEAEEFNFTHPQLGAALLSEWSFPQLMADAVGDHHMRAAVSDDTSMAPVSIVVRLANEIAASIGAGMKRDETFELTADQSWSARALGFDDDALAELTEKVKETFSEEKSLFH